MNHHHCRLIYIIVTLVFFSSCSQKTETSKEQSQTSEYFRAFGQILHVYKENMPALQEKMAWEVAEIDRLEKQNLNAPQLALAHSMDCLLERMNLFTSRLEGLIPPENLREYHDVNLECTKTQAVSIKQIAKALRNQDSKSYKSQMKWHGLYVPECNNRIEAALRKAGYNSPEDIRTIAVGR